MIHLIKQKEGDGNLPLKDKEDRIGALPATEPMNFRNLLEGLLLIAKGHITTLE
jgi:hypothetical protein